MEPPLKLDLSFDEALVDLSQLSLKRLPKASNDLRERSRRRMHPRDGQDALSVEH